MKAKKIIIKIVIVLCIIAVLGVGMWLTMRVLGVDSLDGLRKIVNRYGIWSYLIIGGIEWLQTIFLPISSAIILGFAVAIVGTWEAFFVSWISISLGAITLHFIGKAGGTKFLNWLLSDRETAEKMKKLMQERKLFFVVGMLNPIIPDEILATLSGICKMNSLYVIIAAILTRGICIFFEVFAYDILFSHWWGILLVVLFFIIMITLSIITIKYGGKIEKWFFSKFEKKDCCKCKHCAKIQEDYGDFIYCFKRNDVLKYDKNKCKDFKEIK